MSNKNQKEYEKYFEAHLRLIEQELQKQLRQNKTKPLSIHSAMKYAVSSGGKRFRPILTLAACEACGGNIHDAILPAVAIELIHTYSLVHDDLPALDNDDYRRGKLSAHKKFGEANAILAGDALLTFAFECVSKIKSGTRAVKILKEIAAASGTRGMIGGQVVDIESPKRKKTLKEYDFINRLKTGALIRLCARAGAISANALPKHLKMITRYGELIGLAFQLVDDILDKDGVCKILSYDEAVLKSQKVIAEARKAAASFKNAEPLIFLADFLQSRIPTQDKK